MWSNSDNSGGGSIVLGDNNVLNSSNGRSGDTDSGGGKITLAGGSGSGTNPTGYSSSSTGAGIKLGTSTANHTEIYSGGGDIIVKGSSTATGQADDRDVVKGTGLQDETWSSPACGVTAVRLSLIHI